MLDTVASYYCMQFQGKLMNQILPRLKVRYCCMLSLYVNSRKTKEPNLREWQKKQVSGLILAHLAQIQAADSLFFFKNLALSATIYHGQLLSCTISEKTNDPILRKFSDGQTDRWVSNVIILILLKMWCFFSTEVSLKWDEYKADTA